MAISRDEDHVYRKDGVPYPSVTTILKLLQEDTGGLDRWKDRNDGSGDSKHHEHIYWYSAPRGTICHYRALSLFESEFHAEEEMWGEEESTSMQQVLHGPEDGTFDDASHDLTDITYSILKNHGIVSSRAEYEGLFEGNTRLVDILEEDAAYFVQAFEDICDELGVTSDSVLSVERYMVNDDVGYGGQCDMLYEDPHGNVVVADLKTSSALRQKHRLQSVAYLKGVEQSEWGPDEVDRIEVWRICPDDEEWQVHSHEVPPHARHLTDDEAPHDARYTDSFWFKDKWGDFSYDSLDDMWETFTDLTELAHIDNA